MVRLSVRLELISNSTAGGTNHVTRQTLSNLFKGHTALSADMAIRFEKACGVKAGTSMRMQATNDGAGARGRGRGRGRGRTALHRTAVALVGRDQARTFRTGPFRRPVPRWRHSPCGTAGQARK
ncbi:MAG: helix-turn-helix domain-containing protein [Phenylobacterium sp.]|nr:helix-turn-helix domain-containing protein [Phenylobacterium sp.]